MIMTLLVALVICGFVFLLGYHCGGNRVIEILKEQIHDDFVEK